MSEKPTYEELGKRVRELEQNEEYYLLIADNSTDMIIKHDPDGVYIYASPACHALLGYTPDELIGQSAHDFFHSGDLQNIQKSYQAIQRTPEIYKCPENCSVGFFISLMNSTVRCNPFFT